MVYNWTHYIQSILFPASCLLCGTKGQESREICRDCSNELTVNGHACIRCALPLSDTAPQESLCGGCNSNPPPFDRIEAPYLYQHPLDQLITGFKFRHQLPNGRLLGGLLAERLRPRIDALPQCIVPVPLHRRNLRERAFNQSAELARHLARELGIRWSPDLLHKIRPTAPQHGLNKKARGNNLRNCFHFDNRHQYRHLVLIDDIVTTGATVAAAARVMKKAGVQRVDVWAIARTPCSTR